MQGRAMLCVLLAAGFGCGEPDPCEQGTPGTLCTVAGTGEAAFNGDGKDAIESALYLPSQVRRGPDGLVYIMDFNNHRIRRIESDGRLTTVAGDGFHAAGMVGVPATESPLENPIDFDFLPDGRLVFVSWHDPRVFVIQTDGTLAVIAGGELANLPGEGDGGPATAARFIELRGMAVSRDGAIVIADGGANRVRVIRDGMIYPLAGSGRGYAGDGGPATASALATPTAVAIDGDGVVYIADTENCAIRRIDTTGTISTVAGTGLAGFSGDGSGALTADLSHPEGIAVAPDGTLFIADRLNSRVREVSPDGTIRTIAGSGERGAGGDGPATQVPLGYLGRVQLDDDGGLLIADQTNHVVRKLAR